MSVELPAGALAVRVAEQDLAACVDILLENVFAHTPEGTSFSVAVSSRSAGGRLGDRLGQRARILAPRSGQARDVERRGNRSGLDMARRVPRPRRHIQDQAAP